MGENGQACLFCNDDSVIATVVINKKNFIDDIMWNLMVGLLQSLSCVKAGMTTITFFPAIMVFYLLMVFSSIRIKIETFNINQEALVQGCSQVFGIPMLKPASEFSRTV